MSDEKIKEVDDSAVTFRSNPTKDDFSKMEEFFVLFRKAPAPAIDGQTWLEYYYEILQAPDKRDSDSWKHHFENFDRWIAAFPESPTPLTAKARAHIVHGWEERGSGFANTVTEARWAIFHDQLERAAELLEKARNLKGHDADVYYQLIQIGKASGAEWETIKEYLDAALKIDTLYYPVYEEIAVYLLPRWNGEPGDIGKFGNKVLEDLPEDDGLEVYARIAAEVNKYDLSLLLEGEFDLDKVHAGAKILQARYPNSALYQNLAGLVAWLNQDQELARLVRPVVEKNFVKYVWGIEDRRKQYLKFCSLGTPPHRPQRIVWSFSIAPSYTAISPSGNSLVICYEGRRGSPFEIRSMKDQSIIHQVVSDNLLPGGIAIDSAGKKLAVSYRALKQVSFDAPAALELYSVGDWGNPRLLEDERATSFGALCFSPDGKLLAAAQEGVGIGLWNVENARLERVIEWKKPILRIFFSPDGDHVAAQSSNTAQIAEVATGKSLEQLPSGNNGDENRLMTVIGYLPNGRLLAVLRRQTPGANALVSWDRVTKKFATLIPDVPTEILAVSPKLTFVITAAARRGPRPPLPAVAVWSIPEKRKLAEYDMPGHATGIAFSQDEKTLSFTQIDRSVRIWDLSELLPKSE